MPSDGSARTDMRNADWPVNLPIFVEQLTKLFLPFSRAS